MSEELRERTVDSIAKSFHAIQCGCDDWRAHDHEDPTYDNAAAEAWQLAVAPLLAEKDAEIERLTAITCKHCGDDARLLHTTHRALQQSTNALNQALNERDAARAALKVLERKLLPIARQLKHLPGVYTIGPSNQMHVIELLWGDAKKAADSIVSILAEVVSDGD